MFEGETAAAIGAADSGAERVIPAVRRETFFWLAVAAGFVLFLWLFQAILLPFVVGMAIGYLLDPVMRRLADLGISRGIAAGSLIVGSFLFGLLVLLLVLPVLIDQATELGKQLPQLVAPVRRWVIDILAPAPGVPKPFAELAQQGLSQLAGILGSVVNQGMALINLASLLAVTPLVAFYLLRDWPRIVTELDDCLPRRHAQTIRELARTIDEVLAGFARGAALVCVILAAFYAIALSLVGLEFGLVIGLLAGSLSFVPYLGFVIGLVASVGVALYQFWPQWIPILLVLGIFLSGQVLSDYVLAPRLVGERAGLHPLWVLFGVFAGGALFGFAGMLLAVPACAAIGVLTRFAVKQYKESELYGG